MASTEQANIHAAVQAQPPSEGALLVGWALVAEWARTDGKRSLTRTVSEDATPWQREGYLHAGLYGGGWGDGDDA